MIAKGTTKNVDNRAVYSVFGYFMGGETELFDRQPTICTHSSLVFEYAFGNVKSLNSSIPDEFRNDKTEYQKS